MEYLLRTNGKGEMASHVRALCVWGGKTGMASGVSKNRSGERDDEMTLKKFAGFCGAVTAALFLCATAKADQNFVDFDDYLIAAPVMTAGSMAKGNGTAYLVHESDGWCGFGIDSDDLLQS